MTPRDPPFATAVLMNSSRCQRIRNANGFFARYGAGTEQMGFLLVTSYYSGTGKRGKLTMTSRLALVGPSAAMLSLLISVRLSRATQTDAN